MSQHDNDLPIDRDLILSDEDLLAVAGGSLTIGSGGSIARAPWTGTGDPIVCGDEAGCFPKPTTNIYCKIGDTVTGNCSFWCAANANPFGTPGAFGG